MVYYICVHAPVQTNSPTNVAPLPDSAIEPVAGEGGRGSWYGSVSTFVILAEPDTSNEPVILVIFFILTGPSITTESDMLALPYKTKLPDTSSISPVAENTVGSDPVTYRDLVTINPFVNLPEPDTSKLPVISTVFPAAKIRLLLVSTLPFISTVPFPTMNAPVTALPMFAIP